MFITRDIPNLDGSRSDDRSRPISEDVIISASKDQPNSVVVGVSILGAAVGLGILIILGKVLYLKYRRIQSIHQLPEMFSAESLHSSRPNEPYDFDNLIDIDPMSKGHVFQRHSQMTDKTKRSSQLSGLSGYLVGFLGSPGWETRMRREIDDHRWRQRRESRLRSSRSQIGSVDSLGVFYSTSTSRRHTAPNPRRTRLISTSSPARTYHGTPNAARSRFPRARTESLQSSGSPLRSTRAMRSPARSLNGVASSIIGSSPPTIEMPSFLEFSTPLDTNAMDLLVPDNRSLRSNANTNSTPSLPLSQSNSSFVQLPFFPSPPMNTPSIVISPVVSPSIPSHPYAVADTNVHNNQNQLTVPSAHISAPSSASSVIAMPVTVMRHTNPFRARAQEKMVSFLSLQPTPIELKTLGNMRHAPTSSTVYDTPILEKPAPAVVPMLPSFLPGDVVNYPGLKGSLDRSYAPVASNTQIPGTLEVVAPKPISPKLAAPFMSRHICRPQNRELSRVHAHLPFSLVAPPLISHLPIRPPSCTVSVPKEGFASAMKSGNTGLRSPLSPISMKHASKARLPNSGEECRDGDKDDDEKENVDPNAAVDRPIGASSRADDIRPALRGVDDVTPRPVVSSPLRSVAFTASTLFSSSPSRSSTSSSTSRQLTVATDVRSREKTIESGNKVQVIKPADTSIGGSDPFPDSGIVLQEMSFFGDFMRPRKPAGGNPFDDVSVNFDDANSLRGSLSRRDIVNSDERGETWFSDGDYTSYDGLGIKSSDSTDSSFTSASFNCTPNIAFPSFLPSIHGSPGDDYQSPSVPLPYPDSFWSPSDGNDIEDGDVSKFVNDVADEDKTEASDNSFDFFAL